MACLEEGKNEPDKDRRGANRSAEEIGGESEDNRVEGPQELTRKKRKTVEKDVVGRSIEDGEELVVSPLVGRRALWGGLDPPSGKLLVATSERVEFLYDQDGPLVNDQPACSNLMRQIRGGILP